MRPVRFFKREKIIKIDDFHSKREENGDFDVKPDPTFGVPPLTIFFSTIWQSLSQIVRAVKAVDQSAKVQVIYIII